MKAKEELKLVFPTEEYIALIKFNKMYKPYMVENINLCMADNNYNMRIDNTNLSAKVVAKMIRDKFKL